MGIESNKEAMAMMRKALGSIENRFREAYNKGYHDGLKDGINQATQKLVNKILEEVETDRKEIDDDEIGDCNECRYVGSDKCTDCFCGSMWIRREDDE